MPPSGPFTCTPIPVINGLVHLSGNQSASRQQTFHDASPKKTTSNQRFCTTRITEGTLAKKQRSCPCIWIHTALWPAQTTMEATSAHTTPEGGPFGEGCRSTRATIALTTFGRVFFQREGVPSKKVSLRYPSNCSTVSQKFLEDRLHATQAVTISRYVWRVAGRTNLL